MWACHRLMSIKAQEKNNDKHAFIVVFYRCTEERKNITMNVSLSSSIDAPKKKKTTTNVGLLLSSICKSLGGKKKTMMSSLLSSINGHKKDDNNLSSSIDAPKKKTNTRHCFL